jgi:hypothetical protein
LISLTLNHEYILLKKIHISYYSDVFICRKFQVRKPLKTELDDITHNRYIVMAKHFTKKIMDKDAW